MTNDVLVRNEAAARSETSVVVFLAFIGALMAFGIDAALPGYDDLRLDFDLDARGISPAIVGTVYFIGMAIGQMFAGVLADRFGRRPVLLSGTAIYALGALGSALAVNLELLLVARFVWGLGASAAIVLRLAIARDLFHGDRMARVVTTVTAVFLMGPILAPLLGEALLALGSWRTVFFAAIVLSGTALLWIARFGETLSPDNRREVRLRPIADAFGAVLHTRVTLWAIIAQTFFSAAFFVWLGSAQPILDTIYGRDEQFALFFGCSGIGMAAALLSNKRLIDRHGTATMAIRAASGYLAVSIVGLSLTVAASGRPSVWVWFGWVVIANSLGTVMTPMSTSLALEPMADKAGTVSAILGLAQLGIGAVLAALVDAQIDSTVTPMLVGAVVFGGLGLASLVIATGSTGGYLRVRQQ